MPLAIRQTTIDPNVLLTMETGTRIESEVEWSTEQAKDPKVQVIRCWLSEEEEPTADVLYLQSKTTKRLWSLRKQLDLKEYILYYSWVDHVRCPPRRLIVDHRFSILLMTSKL